MLPLDITKVAEFAKKNGGRKCYYNNIVGMITAYSCLTPSIFFSYDEGWAVRESYLSAQVYELLIPIEEIRTGTHITIYDFNIFAFVPSKKEIEQLIKQLDL